MPNDIVIGRTYLTRAGRSTARVIVTGEAHMRASDGARQWWCSATDKRISLSRPRTAEELTAAETTHAPLIEAALPTGWRTALEGKALLILRRIDRDWVVSARIEDSGVRSHWEAWDAGAKFKKSASGYASTRQVAYDDAVKHLAAIGALRAR